MHFRHRHRHPSNANRKPCGSKWDFGGSPRKGGWLRLGHGVQGGLGSPNDIGLGDKVEVETSTFARFVAEEKAMSLLMMRPTGFIHFIHTLTLNLEAQGPPKNGDGQKDVESCQGLSDFALGF